MSFTVCVASRLVSQAPIIRPGWLFEEVWEPFRLPFEMVMSALRSLKYIRNRQGSQPPPGPISPTARDVPGQGALYEGRERIFADRCSPLHAGRGLSPASREAALTTARKLGFQWMLELGSKLAMARGLNRETLANTLGGELDVEDAGTDTLPADILTLPTPVRGPSLPFPGPPTVRLASCRRQSGVVAGHLALLEGGWRLVAERGVASVRVVEAFHEVVDRHAGFGPACEVVAVQQLALQGREEALAHRVVVGVADRSH